MPRPVQDPKQWLDEFVRNTPIEAIISEYVTLRSRSPNLEGEYIGISPFTNEKTASFTVVGGKNFYHCFSSGMTGNVIKFIMVMENINFGQAVVRLAQIMGVEIPKWYFKKVREYRKGRFRY